MKKIWQNGIVKTFLAGFFALLPFALTIGIIVWLTDWLLAVVGPETLVGAALRNIGLQFSENNAIALCLGYGIVLLGTWALGVLIRSKFNHIIKWFLGIPNKVPFVKNVYGTVDQVVKMLKRDEGENLKQMKVVFCQFHDDEGGFLALSPPGSFSLDQDSENPTSKLIIYIPTSPIPASGWCAFWPKKRVIEVEGMTPEGVMQFYLSMGVMAEHVVPEKYINSMHPFTGQ